MKFRTSIVLFVYGILIVSLIMVLFGFNGLDIDNFINWIIPIGLSLILSAFVGDLIEEVTGDFFKNIYLSFPIWKFRVNIPLFLILVFLIKQWLFG